MQVFFMEKYLLRFGFFCYRVTITSTRLRLYSPSSHHVNVWFTKKEKKILKKWNHHDVFLSVMVCWWCRYSLYASFAKKYFSGFFISFSYSPAFAIPSTPNKMPPSPSVFLGFSSFSSQTHNSAWCLHFSIFFLCVITGIIIK